MSQTIPTLAVLPILLTTVTAQTVPWTQQSPSTMPSVRERTFTATDGNVYYLYGGQLGASTAGLDDLWSWDGLTWTQVTSTSAPGTRCSGVMAWWKT